VTRNNTVKLRVVMCVLNKCEEVHTNTLLQKCVEIDRRHSDVVK